MLVVKNGWKIQAKTRDGSSAVVFSIHYAKSKSDEFTEDVVRGALSATADTYADCLTGASGYQYNVKMAAFCNTGTTTAFITVNLYDGANNTPLCQTWALAPNASLFVGDTVSMTDGNGRIITINGQNADTQPVSTVIDYAGTVVPPGWLNCNGAAISRTTYADLFAAIGTTYGTGDGSTTFNLPDCTGRVTAGKEASATRLTAAGSGVTGSTLGSAGGSEFMQSHKHVYLFGATGAWQTGSTYTQTGGSSTDTSTTGAGNSQNVQPTIVLYKLIKYANIVAQVASSSPLSINGQNVFIQASKPTALLTGDLWYETGTNTWWFWNGTYWLSCELFKFDWSSTTKLTANTSVYCSLDTDVSVDTDIFITHVHMSSWVDTSNSGNSASHYWSLQAYRISTNNSANAAGSAISTSADSVASWYKHSGAVSTLCDMSDTTAGSCTKNLRLDLNRSGTPGDFYGSFGFTYRKAHV